MASVFKAAAKPIAARYEKGRTHRVAIRCPGRRTPRERRGGWLLRMAGASRLPSSSPGKMKRENSVQIAAGSDVGSQINESPLP